jgi:lipopolysaccharide export system permease protein
MKKLEKYILKELGLTFLFIVSILIASLWVIQSLKFIGPFLKSSEGLISFFYLILLTLPDLLGIITPVGLFIAVVILYNRFHTDRELPVMFSSGYGRWQIARPALVLAGGVTVFIYVLNIFILPASFGKMRDMEMRLKSSLPSVLVQEGVFNSFGDITIYVNKKKNHNLNGIIAHIQKDKKNPYTIIAKEGQLVVEERMPKIFMEHGTRQERDLGTGELSILYFDRTIISLEEESKAPPSARPKKPYELSIVELISPNNIALPHGQKLYAEGYQRLLSPLYSLAFSMVGLCFLLYAPFRRRGQFLPIFHAVFVVLLLESFSLFLMNLGAQTPYGILGAYFLMIGTIAVCFLILKKGDTL